MSDECFPEGFIWGCATAAYQIEGAVNVSGRGPSIWDEFSHTPGNIKNGDTGDVADEFFFRYREDIQLMRDLDLSAFRFSIAWPRVFPDGVGRPNIMGLDFYYRMIDSLLESGIQPFCTLYHWDLPRSLQEKGGWENPDTAKAFADYAGYVASKLSDRIEHFITMNEMRSFVERGYELGVHAPGLRLSRKRLAQLNHHVVLGHGLAVSALRSYSRSGTSVGLADLTIATTPVYESEKHIAAARIAMREENASYLTVVQEGQYTEGYLRRLGADCPSFTPEEMDIIKSPLDFVGINTYSPTYIRFDDSDRGYDIVPAGQSFPRAHSPWLHIGPEALYWASKLVAETWNVHTIFITENGASCSDDVTACGKVYDIDRIMFLRSYLTQLVRAIKNGVPIKGYFLWSLLDNFEWSDGYGTRFGIVHVDYSTQVRKPKLSAEFYKHVIREKRVV